MRVAADTVVTLSWRLTDAQNDELAQDQEGGDFYIGGSDLLPAIERELMGKTAGASGALQIEPEDAFGDDDAMLLRIEDLTLFPVGLEVGMQFEQLPQGCEPGPAGTLYTVTDIVGDKVVLDGNHPLAGIALRLYYTILDVRQPDPDEAEARTALLDDVDSGMFLAPRPAE